VANPYVNDKGARGELADALSRLLADSYTLYLKTHKFHWNVTGPNFVALHGLFMQEYTELSAAVDLIAERIRALGPLAPGSYSEFMKLGKVKDEPGAPGWQDMVRQLAADNTTVARTAAEVIAVAEKFDDVATADLATERVNIHEKSAWMLNSILAQ
jgi:starvation-inducible DNA-binding protein